MGTSWVALSIKNIKTRASREMASRKNIKHFMGWTLPSTGMWWGEVFVISDCLVNLARQGYCSQFVVMTSKIPHDVKKYVMTSIRFHDIKNFVMMSKICYDVKKCIMTSKRLSWRQEYLMTSKSSSQNQKWRQKVCHNVINRSWCQKVHHNLNKVQMLRTT